MRIAYLCCDFGVPLVGTRSGASVHVRATVGALRNRGHKVLLLSPHTAPAAPGGLTAEVARLLAHEDAAPDHVGRELRVLHFCEHVRAMHAEIAAFAPDALYERYALFGYAGTELAHAQGVPHLLEVNAPLFHEQATHRKLVLRRTAAELEARIFRSADRVLVVSRELAAHARRLGVPGERIALAPNGVDPELFHPAVSGAAVRARLGLEDRPVIGFVGSLKPWHDLDTLIAAVGVLARDRPDIRLLVVGDGPRRGQLGDTAVIATGAVDHALVPAHLAAMDVVVVPYSRGSGTYFSPLKLFEAMAMARPVVVARIGDLPEAVDGGAAGFLYEPDSAEDLALAIAAVLETPRLGGELGAAAREVVLRHHTWAASARRIEALAEDLRRRAAAS